MVMLASGRLLHALHHFARELRVALGGKAYAKGPRRYWAKLIAVDPGARTFQQTTMDQCAQQRKTVVLGSWVR
jgi:hypothetical protein